MGMTISDPISLLEGIKSKEGDVRVFLNGDRGLYKVDPQPYNVQQIDMSQHALIVGERVLIL